MSKDPQQPDLNEIKSLIDKGAAAAWTDAAGNSLLHHAARLGDGETVERCFSEGIKAFAYNKADECPRDIARSWGHDAIALRLDAQMQMKKL